MTPRIFISYAKKDTRYLAEALYTELNMLPGISAWMDTSLEAGSSWAGQIQREIDLADYVVVLLSPDVNRTVTATQRRSFVLNEIDYAQQENKPILPVMVQQTKMPVQIAGIQYIDLTQRPYDPDPIVKRIRQRFNHASTPEPIIVPKEERQQLVRPMTAKSASLARKSQRSQTPLIIGVVGTLVLTASVALIVLPRLINPSPPPTATTRQAVQAGIDTPPTLPNTPDLMLIVGQTQTHEVEQTLTAMPTTTWTPTATLTPTVDFQATIDAIATGTRVSLQTANAAATLTAMPTQTPFPLGYPGNPVTANEQWTEVITQEFDGVMMVFVPVGCFDMGNDPDAYAGSADGGRQCFDAPFWIDQTEVTNGQYGSEGRFNGADLPRESVTWFEARDFCESRDARLPTEPEWEYAARGPNSLVYPWGNDWVSTNAVWNTNQTANVGSIPAGASWVGALDMSGNVWEWVSSLYADYLYDLSHENYSYTTRDRILRGGSWNDFDPTFLRIAGRNWINPNGSGGYFGFRCARSF